MIIVLFVAQRRRCSPTRTGPPIEGRTWLPMAGAALALALAGCMVQGFEWANLGFSPTKGGYASVFLGWTLLFTVFALVAIYWLEIVFVTGLRHRKRRGLRTPRARRRLLLLDAAGGRRR